MFEFTYYLEQQMYNILTVMYKVLWRVSMCLHHLQGVLYEIDIIVKGIVHFFGQNINLYKMHGIYIKIVWIQVAVSVVREMSFHYKTILCFNCSKRGIFYGNGKEKRVAEYRDIWEINMT